MTSPMSQLDLDRRRNHAPFSAKLNRTSRKRQKRTRRGRQPPIRWQTLLKTYKERDSPASRTPPTAVSTSLLYKQLLINNNRVFPIILQSSPWFASLNLHQRLLHRPTYLLWSVERTNGLATSTKSPSLMPPSFGRETTKPSTKFALMWNLRQLLKRT